MKKIVSVTADGSHEDKGQNKEVRSLLPQKYTDDIIATFNSEYYSLYTNDDKEYDFTKITTEYHWWWIKRWNLRSNWDS